MRTENYCESSIFATSLQYLQWIGKGGGGLRAIDGSFTKGGERLYIEVYGG